MFHINFSPDKSPPVDIKTRGHASNAPSLGAKSAGAKYNFCSGSCNQAKKTPATLKYSNLAQKSVYYKPKSCLKSPP